MGVSAGEWLIALIGFIGTLSSVGVGSMLSSLRTQNAALWEAINENRKSIADTGNEVAEIRGQLKGYGHRE